MKNLFHNIISLSIISLLLYSCEDEAKNIKLPSVDKKIVVQCFISPDDDTIIAMVSWSKPVIGTTYSSNPDIINNAAVIISDENISDTLKWDKTSELYLLINSKFKIETGKKYYLKVELPNGIKVTANCTIPNSKNQTLTLHKIDSTIDQWDNIDLNLIFKYKDHENSKFNYYRFESKLIGWHYNYDLLNSEFKTDKDLREENYYSNSFLIFPGSDPKSILAYLISCDYNYYHYHKSLQNAQYNFGIFTEPTIVFTNIDGGLGCFGAYYSYSIETKIR